MIVELLPKQRLEARLLKMMIRGECAVDPGVLHHSESVREDPVHLRGVPWI